MTTISCLQAIRDAQLEEMRRDERVFIMGEDVAWNMLGSTEGFVEEFGAERVRNTPITEAAFTAGDLSLAELSATRRSIAERVRAGASDGSLTSRRRPRAAALPGTSR
jgi:pyruvate/2-oxoglutarate/acetoin dehydrogenase E1 component